jgi:FMN reductase
LPPEGNPRIAVILGSVTAPGRLRRALAAAVEAKTEAGAAAELFDLAEHTVAYADGADPDSLGDDTGFLVGRIAAADAVILATPVYRGSLSGSLKNLIDHTPLPALAGKPVGIVAMGGSDHHFLGAERHGRDILAFFGARVAPLAVYITSADFDAAGEPGERALEALAALFAELERQVAALGTEVAA